MFQFPGFASSTYGFSAGYPSLGGLPHSEIHGSMPARGSPWLIAACNVLHRLSVPRHPPDALQTLDPLGTPTRRDNPARGPPKDAFPGDRHPTPNPEPPPHGETRNPRCRRDLPRSHFAHSVFTMSQDPRRPNPPMREVPKPKGRRVTAPNPRVFPILLSRIMSQAPSAPSTPEWWRRTGSNRRPHACKARALPTELRPQFFGPPGTPTSRCRARSSHPRAYLALPRSEQSLATCR